MSLCVHNLSATSANHRVNPIGQDAPPLKESRNWDWKAAVSVVLNHLKKHAGVGVVCAVAYFDPGNWGVDLQAGSQFGYSLLFIVFLAGLFAVFLQALASKLGCVTGLDLASHCRLLLHSPPSHPLLSRWLLLYPLYVLSEISIIATDLAELLGSAIALCMLFPALPLWAGVLITSVDVVLVLAMGNPLGGRPLRLFEGLIAALVLAVLICMVVIITKVSVDWGEAFKGYIPSKFIFQHGGLYTSVGILGATVMPHSLYLGSALATQDRISSGVPHNHHVYPLQYFAKLKTKLRRNKNSMVPINTGEPGLETPDASPLEESCESQLRRGWEWRRLALRLVRRQPDIDVEKQRCSQGQHVIGTGGSSNSADRIGILHDTGGILPSRLADPKSHAERPNNTLEFVRAHLYHGVADVVGSLLGFAVLINSLILILASAVFFYGAGGGGAEAAAPASLFDAYDLIRNIVGKPAGYLFAIALLAAGQSSSLIATVAGQAVSEGFLRWKIPPVTRRLITRLIGLVPAMTISVALGRPGINALLVASQVILSVILPFVMLPLMWLTSRREIMSVVSGGRRGGEKMSEPPAAGVPPGAVAVPQVDKVASGSAATPVPLPDAVLPLEAEADVVVPERASEEVVTGAVDFSNSRLTTAMAWVVWLMVMGANLYVIITLLLGSE